MMNVKGMIIAKKQLQFDIAELIKKFEVSTGLNVTNIVMDRVYMFGPNDNVIDIPIDINIEVRLPWYTQ